MLRLHPKADADADRCANRCAIICPNKFAVFTGADCAIDGLDPVSCDMFLKRPNGGAY